MEGLIFSVIVLSSAISGVISSSTPAKTDSMSSLSIASPVVPPDTNVSALLSL